MIDPVQIVLLIVIILLTLLLLVLGVQVFFILKELRNTITRANRVLENTESITESVSEPMSFLSGILFNARSISTISKILKKVKENGEE
ncbi:MAG TPA: hypothetical protein VG917_03820 [Patescibacteria group bacterium]|nr:hypothetical protein [Patescibacteria group bacterium]